MAFENNTGPEVPESKTDNWTPESPEQKLQHNASYLSNTILIESNWQTGVFSSVTFEEDNGSITKISSSNYEWNSRFLLENWTKIGTSDGIPTFVIKKQIFVDFTASWDVLVDDTKVTTEQAESVLGKIEANVSEFKAWKKWQEEREREDETAELVDNIDF